MTQHTSTTLSLSCHLQGDDVWGCPKLKVELHTVKILSYKCEIFIKIYLDYQK